MTQETLDQAKALESEINYASYWLEQASRIRTCNHTIKIVEQCPDGTIMGLAMLEPGDPLIETIASVLVGRLRHKVKSYEEQLKNL